MTVANPTFEPKRRTGLGPTLASLFLTLAYRSFAATQCAELPLDPRAGIIAILNNDSGWHDHDVA